jgi:hypothetical protein
MSETPTVTTDPPAEPSQEQVNNDRMARLEQLLEQQRADNLAQVEALQEQLNAAMARPQKLQAPGKFVGRTGAPDSPVADHYTLVLANGDLVDMVHPGVTHVAVAGSDRLVPVVNVYHSIDVQNAQRGAE